MESKLVEAFGQCKTFLRCKLEEKEGRVIEPEFSIASLAPFPTYIVSVPWKGC